MRLFKQVDVFTSVPHRGNPVAVVMDGAGLDDAAMQRFASWTNLSETTFVLPPSVDGADYRVRIFTPSSELPFAGHPTIGTCHAWLEAGGAPKDPDRIVQECGVGRVALRRERGRLAFAAPPLVRDEPVEDALLERVRAVLAVAPERIVEARHADNGPGWLAVRLDSAEAVRALAPDLGAAEGEGVGVVGPHPLGVFGPCDGAGPDEPAIEVRAFFRAGGAIVEDPVTGSLNAGLGQWLLLAGDLPSPYVAAQGSALGRAGRVHVEEADGEVWVGGDAVTCVDGRVGFEEPHPE